MSLNNKKGAVRVDCKAAEDTGALGADPIVHSARQLNRPKAAKDESLWLRVLSASPQACKVFGKRRRDGGSHSKALADVRRLVALCDNGETAELEATLSRVSQEDFAKLFCLAVAHARANLAPSEANEAKRTRARELRGQGWSNAAISKHLGISTTRLHQLIGPKTSKSSRASQSLADAG
ncbi:hypothetical protein ACS5PK_08270 [Roseateles sp. DB2]|uniref:hypothetical protein n=1 Tax=Roseateles sp. DB2 TaxID=3453717 RepID=UPI003EF03F20